MQKFYFELWFFWALRVIICSVFFALLFAALITAAIYLKQGMPTLEKDINAALWDVFSFWFFFMLNIAVLLALFRSVKYLFNRPYAGYVLRLKMCDKEENKKYIEPVGYGDLVKVWRKWFMLLIWIVGALMILALAFTYLFTSYTTLFAWFNIYVLYGFILLGGYFSFVLMGARCKNVKILKC